MVFEQSQITDIINKVWTLQIHRPPMFILSRKLNFAREHMKAWCLDQRMFRGVNWKANFYITTRQQGTNYLHRRTTLFEEANIGILYWKATHARSLSTSQRPSFQIYISTCTPTQTTELHIYA